MRLAEQRRAMVAAVRRGASQRSVARAFGVSLHTVQRWCERAAGQRLDRVDFTARPPVAGRTGRTSVDLEDLIVDVRRSLRDESALGEYGARAIHRELLARAQWAEMPMVPAVRTIGRILERRGELDRRRRVRRPAPPVGWYLPSVAARQVELDSLDVIEDLRLRGGIRFDVLTSISIHGALAAAWPQSSTTGRSTIEALHAHWRAHGLPGYVQFDNDTRFHGVHGFADRLGRVVRFCHGLGVTPVFVPPRESGFQAAIESFNGRWRAKVWQRFWFETLEDVVAISERFVAATRVRSAIRIEAAPPRRSFPDALPTIADQKSRTIVYLRRTGENGSTSLLGQRILVDRHWVHRLVRVELDLGRRWVRCYALRRREPDDQPLLAELPSSAARKVRG